MFVRLQNRDNIVNLDSIAEVSITECETALNKRILKEYLDAGIQTIYRITLYSESGDGSFIAAGYIDRQGAEDALEALCDVLRDGRSYFEFSPDYKFMEVQNERS